MSCEFKPNMRVQTNDVYFERYKVRAKGYIIEPKIDIAEHTVIMRWEHQEGEIQPELEGLMVLMNKKFVEPVY